MTIPALKLEVKKDGFQQLQSGAYKLTVTLQPADMHDNDETLLLDFIKAPMGQRYYIGMAEIGDDEQPISPQTKSARKPAATRAEKARRHWWDIPIVEQAGILCTKFDFQTWAYMEDGSPTAFTAGQEHATLFVRAHCGVKSRTELARPDNLPTHQAWEPAAKFNDLQSSYMEAMGHSAARAL